MCRYRHPERSLFRPAAMADRKPPPQHVGLMGNLPNLPPFPPTLL